jgi:hypothetical protein
VYFAIDTLPGSTVSVTSTSQDSTTFLSLYLDSFDPQNPASNYLGDEGKSEAGITFSVTVPGDGHLLFVGNTVDSNAIGHGFSANADFTPGGGSVADDSSTALLLLLALATLIGLQTRALRQLRLSPA